MGFEPRSSRFTDLSLEQIPLPLLRTFHKQLNFNLSRISGVEQFNPEPMEDLEPRNRPVPELFSCLTGKVFEASLTLNITWPTDSYSDE